MNRFVLSFRKPLFYFFPFLSIIYKVSSNNPIINHIVIFSDHYTLYQTIQWFDTIQLFHTLNGIPIK